MKRIFSISFLFFLFIFISCKKSSENDTLIRIQNATAENFTAFQLNATSFGPIKSGMTTDYKSCGQVLPVPFSNGIKINDTLFYIVDIMPTPYLKSGHYLIKVVSDTTSFRYAGTLVNE